MCTTAWLTALCVLATTVAQPYVFALAPESSNEKFRELAALGERVAQGREPGGDSFPLAIQGFLDARKNPIARATIEKGLLSDFSVLPAEDGARTQIQKAQEQLKAYKADAMAFRASRLARLLSGLIKPRYQGKFFQDAKERLEDMIAEIRNDLESYGLKLPERIVLEVHAGMARFSSLHKENGDLRIAVDVELLRKKVPKEVLRFFLTHEILHAALGAEQNGYDRCVSEIGVMALNLAMLWKNDHLDKVVGFFKWLAKPHAFGLAAARKLAADSRLARMLDKLARMRKYQVALMKSFRRPNLQGPDMDRCIESLNDLQRKAFAQIVNIVGEWISTDSEMHTDHFQTEWLLAKLKENPNIVTLAGLPSADIWAFLLEEHREANRRALHQLLNEEKVAEWRKPPLRQLLQSEKPVLLIGEDGLHKHFLARHIHHEGKGAQAPFRMVDALLLRPGTLAENLKPGSAWMQAIEGGTLYVHRPERLRPDDVEAIAAARNVRFVFSSTDPKLIAPDMSVRLGIGNHVHRIPALRDRSFNDKARIFRHLLEKFRVLEGKSPMRFSPDAMRKLAEHKWPGNIFECESVIHRAVLLAEGPQIERWDLPLRPEGISWQWELAAPLARSRLNVLVQADNPRTAGKFVRRMLAYEKGDPVNVLEVDARALVGRNLRRMLHGDERTGQPGLLARAHGGAIVLHNAEHLSQRAQRELLRMLLLGGFQDELTGEPESVNVRWFFTTPLDFNTLFEAGRFIPDLSYWIDQFPVKTLPLKERRDAIPETVEDILRMLAQQAGRAPPSVDRKTGVLLQAYPWSQAEDLRDALARALERSTWGIIEPKHLDPELRLDAQAAGVVSGGKSHDGLAAEYYGEEAWGLARAAVPAQILQNTILTNPESIEAFAQGMRGLRLMPTLQFSASEIQRSGTADEQNLRWLAMAFSPDTVQALWQKRQLLALMRYFYEGRGKEEDLRAIAMEMEKHHPALRDYWDRFRYDPDLVHAKRLAFLRMMRLLFQLRLGNTVMPMPSHTEILSHMDTDAAMEHFLLQQAAPYVSRQAADHIERRKEELGRVPADLMVPDEPLREVKNWASQANILKFDARGVIVKAKAGGREVSTFMPMPLMSEDMHSFPLGLPGELAGKINAWVMGESADLDTVEAVACVRIRPSESADQIQEMQHAPFLTAIPRFTDFISWNGDVRQDERRVVEAALRIAKAKTVPFRDIPVIFAQGEAGTTRLAAYRILNTDPGVSLMRMHERLKERVDQDKTWKGGLRQLAEWKDPSLLVEQKAVEVLALCHEFKEEGKKRKERILPPFSHEDAWKSAAVPVLPDVQEQALLELLMHPKENEFLVPIAREPGQGMVKDRDLPKDKEEIWDAAVKGMELEQQGQIEAVFQNVGTELLPNQENRLMDLIFVKPTAESKRFIETHYHDRTAGDTGPLRKAVEGMFKDLLANRRTDPARAKALALLFAKLYGLLLRQNEADLELKFGNNHNAEHDMNLLNTVEAFMQKNPVLTEAVLKQHYGPEAMSLVRLTILLHDVGYVEYVQKQRRRDREKVDDPLPKSVHSALSVKAVDEQLKALMEQALDVGKDKLNQPGQSIYNDITEAILFHSVSKKKEKDVVYDEKRNPLLFLVTLADKLDYMKTRVKPNFMKLQGLLPVVEEYLAAVNLQGPKPHRREELRAMIIRLKQEAPAEYINFIHSYSTLGIKDVRVRLKYEDRYITASAYEKMPAGQKAKVRLSIWTQVDHYAVDLTKGIEEDEANNPALLQTGRVRHALHPFDFNNAKVECEVSFHPLELPEGPFKPPRIPIREEVLREVQRLFPNVAAGPEDMEAFEAASTEPQELEKSLRAVRSVLGSLMPSYHAAFFEDSKTSYPFVLAMAKKIDLKEIIKAVRRRLQELVPADVPSDQRKNYLENHLLEFDTWDKWARQVVLELLVHKGKLEGTLEDPGHWHAFQGPDQLTGAFSRIVDEIKGQYPDGIPEIAILQREYPPHTMRDLAKVLHARGWQTKVRGMALPHPVYLLTFPDGEKVLAEQSGRFASANVMATVSVKLLRDLEHKINMTCAKVSRKIEEEADLHDDAWRKDWQARTQAINIEAQQVFMSAGAPDHQRIHRLKELVKELSKVALEVDGDFDTTHLLHEQKRWDVLEPEFKERVASILEPTPPKGGSEEQEQDALSATREGVRIEGANVNTPAIFQEWVSKVGHGQYAGTMEFDAQATMDQIRKRKIPAGRSPVLIEFNNDEPLHPVMVSHMLPQNGLYFRGYGLRERRASDAVEKARRWGAIGATVATEKLAFAQYQKTAPGVLSPRTLTWGISSNRKGFAKLPLDQIQRLLTGNEPTIFRPLLLSVDRRIKENIIVDEASKREALRHAAVLLADAGLHVEVDDQNGWMSLAWDEKNQRWGSPVHKDTVTMLVRIMGESQRPNVLRSALGTFSKIFVKSKDAALRREMVRAMQTIIPVVSQSWDAYRQGLHHLVGHMFESLAPEEWEGIWKTEESSASWKKAALDALVLGNNPEDTLRIAKPLAHKLERDGDSEGIEKLWPVLLSLSRRMTDPAHALRLANIMAKMDGLRADTRSTARRYMWLRELAFRAWIAPDPALREDMQILLRAVFLSANNLEEFYGAFARTFVRKTLAGENPLAKVPTSREQLQKLLGDVPFVGLLKKTLARMEDEGTLHRSKDGLFRLTNKGYAFLNRLTEAKAAFEKASEAQLQAYLQYWAQRKETPVGMDSVLPAEHAPAQGLHEKILDILLAVPEHRRQEFEGALHKMLLRVDRIRGARFPGPRGTLAPGRLQEIMAEKDFKVLHEMRLSTDPAELSRPGRGKDERELQSVWRQAHKQIRELSLYKNLGIRGPPVSQKTIRFVRHPELLGTAQHAEGWSDPYDRDIIHITYDIWQRLGKNERAALLVHEIIESEALKNNIPPDKAHTLGERAEWEVDPYRHLDRHVLEILRGEKTGFRFTPAQFLLHDAVKSGMREQGYDAIAVDETVMVLTLLERFEQAALRHKSVRGHGVIVDMMGWVAGMAGSDVHAVSRFKKEKLYRGAMRMLMGLFGADMRGLAHAFYQKLQDDKRNWTDILAFFATHYGYLPYKLVEGHRVIAEKDWSAFRLSPEFMALLEEILFASALMPWQSPDNPSRLQLVQIAPMAQKAWEDVAVPASLWPARHGSRPRNLWRLFHVPSRAHMRGKLRLLQDTAMAMAGDKMLKAKRWAQLRFLKRVLKGLKAVQGLQARSTPSVADRTPIHYRVGGNPDAKRTLFFVHGWSGNLYHWIMQIPFFAKRYRIVLMDLRGHGNTPLAGDPAKFITDLSPRDILSILEAEGIFSHVTLVGHSMGGMVAQELMQKILLSPKEPVRGADVAPGKPRGKTFGDYRGMFDSLVLLNTTARSPLETSYFGNSRLKPIVRRLLETLTTWTKSLQGSRIEDLFYSLLHPEEEISWVEDWVNQHLLTGENDLAFDYLLPITMQPSRGLTGEPDYAGPYGKITYAWKGMRQHDTQKVLPALGSHLRVLVVHGPGDDFTRLQDVRSDFEKIAGVEMHNADGEKHMAHFERPKMVDEINGRIQAFLDTLGGRRPFGPAPRNAGTAYPFTSLFESSMLAPESAFGDEEKRRAIIHEARMRALRSPDAKTREDMFIAMATDVATRKDLARALSEDRGLIIPFSRSDNAWISDTAFFWLQVRDYLAYIVQLSSPSGENPDLLKDFTDFLVQDETVLADVTALAEGFPAPACSMMATLLEETLRDAKGIPYARKWRESVAVAEGQDFLAAKDDVFLISPMRFRLADLEKLHQGIHQSLTTESLPALHHPAMFSVLRDFIPKVGEDSKPLPGYRRDESSRQKVRDVFKTALLPLIHLEPFMIPLQRDLASMFPTQDMLYSRDQGIRENAFIAMAKDAQKRKALIQTVFEDPDLFDRFTESRNNRIRRTMFVWNSVSSYLRKIADIGSAKGDNPPLLRKFATFLLADQQLFHDITAMASESTAFRMRALIGDCLWDLPQHNAYVDYWRSNVRPDDAAGIEAFEFGLRQGNRPGMDFSLSDLERYDETLLEHWRRMLLLLQPGNFQCDMAMYLPKISKNGDLLAPEIEDSTLADKAARALDGLFDFALDLNEAGERIQAARHAHEEALDTIGREAYLLTKQALLPLKEGMNFWRHRWEGLLTEQDPLAVRLWFAYDKMLQMLFGGKPWTSAYMAVLRDANTMLPVRDDESPEAPPPEMGLLYQLILQEPSRQNRANLRNILACVEVEHMRIIAFNKSEVPQNLSVLNPMRTSYAPHIPITYRKAAQVLTSRREKPGQEKKPWALFLQRQADMGAGWAGAMLREAVQKDPALKALLPEETQIRGALRLPMVQRLDTQFLSFDDTIRKAEQAGHTRKIEDKELKGLLQRFEQRVFRDERFGLSGRMPGSSERIMAEAIESLFRNLAPLTPEKARNIFRDALNLLSSGKIELHIVTKLPKTSDGKDPMGFYARKDEVKTDNRPDNTLDAHNLPFPVRRLGNKLYMTEAFYEQFAAADPRTHSIFWEALMHDLLEDPSLRKPFGVNVNKAHAFASALTPLIASNHFTHVQGEPRDMYAWMLSFYTPDQLAGFLQHHPGVSALRLRKMALRKLLADGQTDLVGNVLLNILSAQRFRDEARSQWQLGILRDVQGYASRAYEGRAGMVPGSERDRVGESALDVMEALEGTLFKALDPVWHKRYRLRGNLHDALGQWVENGDLDYQKVHRLAKEANARYFVRHALQYLSDTFDWTRPQDQMPKVLDAMKHNVEWANLNHPEQVMLGRMFAIVNDLLPELERRFEALERLHALAPEVKAQFHKTAATGLNARPLLEQYRVHRMAQERKSYGPHAANPFRLMNRLHSRLGLPRIKKKDADIAPMLLVADMGEMKQDRPEDFKIVQAFGKELRRLYGLCQEQAIADRGDIVAANLAAAELEKLGLPEGEARLLVRRLALLSRGLSQKPKSQNMQTILDLRDADRDLLDARPNTQSPYPYWSQHLTDIRGVKGIKLMRWDILGKPRMAAILDRRHRRWKDLEALGFSRLKPQDMAMEHFGFWLPAQDPGPLDSYLVARDSVQIKLATAPQRLVYADRRLLGREFRDRHGIDFSLGGLTVMDIGIGYPPDTTRELTDGMNQGAPPGRPNRMIALDKSYPAHILTSRREEWLHKLGDAYAEIEILFDRAGDVQAVLSAGEFPDVITDSFAAGDLEAMKFARQAAEAGKPGHASETVATPQQKFGRPDMFIMEGDAFDPPVPARSLDLIRCFNVVQHYTPWDAKRMVQAMAGKLKEGGVMLIGSGEGGRRIHYVVYQKQNGRAVTKEYVFHARECTGLPDKEFNSTRRAINDLYRNKKTGTHAQELARAQNTAQLLRNAGFPAVCGEDGLISVPLEPNGMAVRTRKADQIFESAA